MNRSHSCDWHPGLPVCVCKWLPLSGPSFDVSENNHGKGSPPARSVAGKYWVLEPTLLRGQDGAGESSQSLGGSGTHPPLTPSRDSNSRQGPKRQSMCLNVLLFLASLRVLEEVGRGGQDCSTGEDQMAQRG